MLYRKLNSVNTRTSAVTSKNESGRCQVSLLGAKSPLLRTTDADFQCGQPTLGLIQDPVTHMDAFYLLECSVAKLSGMSGDISLPR